MRIAPGHKPSRLFILAALLVALTAGPAMTEMPRTLSTFDSPSALTRDFTRQQLQRGEMDVIADPTDAGNTVARMTAGPKRGSQVGKAALIQAFPPVGAGHVVEMQARVYAPEGTKLDSLILMDLECASCGLDTNPGIRLYLRDSRIRVDRSKIGLKDPFLQSRKVTLQAGRWYEITWRVVLGAADIGRSTVLLDGETIMDAYGETLLLQEVVDRIAKVSVKELVDRFQVGLTANSNRTAQVLLIDDVRLGIR